MTFRPEYNVNQMNATQWNRRAPVYVVVHTLQGQRWYRAQRFKLRNSWHYTLHMQQKWAGIVYSMKWL